MDAENDMLDLTTLPVAGDDRYARQRLITWWDQPRVRAARVCVVGAGALGNEVIKNLALLGVGQIVIVDRDTIELSNLARTVLFRAADVGAAKASVAARHVRELNSEVDAVGIVGDIDGDVGLGLLRRMDVIIGCLDNREARRVLNIAAWRIQRTWVDGGITALDGMVRVFSPTTPGSACYECTLTADDYRLLYTNYSCPPSAAPDAPRMPTTATAAAFTAALQTQEAFKVLHHLPTAIATTTYFSGDTLHVTQVQHLLRADCFVHFVYPTIHSLSLGADTATVGDLFRALEPFGWSVQGIALHTPLVTAFWCPICHISTSVLLRHPTMLTGDTLCPTCHNHRFPTIREVLTDAPELHDTQLRQLFIPPLALLSVLTATSEQIVELSADSARFDIGASERRSQ